MTRTESVVAWSSEGQSWESGDDDRPHLIIPLVRLDEGADARDGRPPSAVLTGWCKLAADASDHVLVLEPAGRVVAISGAAAALLGDWGPDQVVGRHLLDVIALVDFNPTPGEGALYADRIPPLLALASNTLSRGLLRIRCGERIVTLDAIGAPLHDEGGELVGAIAFLASLTA